MRADNILPNDERWAYGHLLYSVSSVRNDGLHVYAKVYWAAFDCYDDVTWWVGQEVPGIARIKTPGLTRVIIDTDNVIDPVSGREKRSDVERLKSWLAG